MKDNRLPGHNSERLLSLDVLRGITVAGMILVTDPGSYDAAFPQLLHVPWQGAHFADMVFPSFLLMTGVALTLSIAKRTGQGAASGRLWWHLLRRCVILVLFGLLVNAFPDFSWHTLRLPGILQRIGICYLLAGSLYLLLRRYLPGESGANRSRRLLILALTASGLLIGYTLLLRFVPVPGFGAGRLDSYGSLPAYVDRMVFGVQHLWVYGTTPGVGVTFDPEGLLSTIPALATTLFGVSAGEILRGPEMLSRTMPESSGDGLSRRTLAIAITAAVLLATGIALQPVLPWIKKINTASFACFSAGIALAAFALLLYVVDVRGWRRGWLPFRIFGTNAILAFVVSGAVTVLLDRLHLQGETAHHWLYTHLCTGWLSARNGSLAYALAIVAANALLLWPLYRQGRFLRL